MKKAIINIAIMIVASIAFIMMCAEAETTFAQILCTSVSAFVLYLCGKGLDYVNKEEVEHEL